MLSIITINYNNSAGLEKTIKSVIKQAPGNFEYIIVDGGSNDDSLNIIKQHQLKISKWVSEPDNGVYHAMNKGIMMSGGDYILFLNSGDYFSETLNLNKVIAEYLIDRDIIYGNLYLEKDGAITREKIYPDSLGFKYFYYLNESLPHPATFIRKSLLEKVGYYNEKYKVVSDWEFWLKAIFLFQATYLHLPFPISVFNLEGLSSGLKGLTIDKLEREEVYQQYFSWLIDDYNEQEVKKNRINKNIYIRILRKLKLLNNEP
ncbi:MAG: glycosyltransferase family 2 protein [Chitinophagaceae bacterium]